MAAGESSGTPRSTANGVPSRSQNGRSMKRIPLQQAAQSVCGTPFAAPQATHRGVDEGDGGLARAACDDADAVESPQARGGVGRFICRIAHGTATIACRRPLARRAHLPAVERASAIALA